MDQQKSMYSFAKWWETLPFSLIWCASTRRAFINLLESTTEDLAWLFAKWRHFVFSLMSSSCAHRVCRELSDTYSAYFKICSDTNSYLSTWVIFTTIWYSGKQPKYPVPEYLSGIRIHEYLSEILDCDHTKILSATSGIKDQESQPDNNCLPSIDFIDFRTSWFFLSLCQASYAVLEYLYISYTVYYAKYSRERFNNTRPPSRDIDTAIANAKNWSHRSD